MGTATVTTFYAASHQTSIMAVPRPSIVEIQGFLQPFPYGREGESSMAARIAKEVDPSTEIKPNQPYGEIWIGSTHANGPATVLSGSQKGTPLKDLLATDPKFYLGEPLLSNATMQRMYKNDLPFLFKILSFDKALPLQAHPDPQLGKQLRQQEAAQKGKNEDFVDDNGKPEISVALSDFTAFVGFRPPSHIAAFMDAVPEFAALFTSAQIDDIKRAASTPDDSVLSKKALRSLFDTIMHMPGAEIQGYVSAIAEKVGLAENKVAAFNKAITEKLESGGPSAAFGDNENASSLARVWKRNAELFGETDVGIIVTTYLMNLLELKPGHRRPIPAPRVLRWWDGSTRLKTHQVRRGARNNCKAHKWLCLGLRQHSIWNYAGFLARLSLQGSRNVRLER